MIKSHSGGNFVRASLVTLNRKRARLGFNFGFFCKGNMVGNSKNVYMKVFM